MRVNPTGSGLREYFMLRTAGVHSGVVPIGFDMNNIKNFRDAGGYFTTDNRQVKWVRFIVPAISAMPHYMIRADSSIENKNCNRFPLGKDSWKVSHFFIPPSEK